MPWHETEALFQSTIKAAKEASLPINGTDSTPEVVDMGEAGRQEVWKGGSRCITKMIAKHGGMYSILPQSSIFIILVVGLGYRDEDLWIAPDRALHSAGPSFVSVARVQITQCREKKDLTTALHHIRSVQIGYTSKRNHCDICTPARSGPISSTPRNHQTNANTL